MNSDREHVRVRDRELVRERLFVSVFGVRVRLVFVNIFVNACS